MRKITKLVLKDGTELEVGRFYRWSGYKENLFTDFRWKGTMCKIKNITENEVEIFDIFADKTHTWSVNSLNKQCKFHKPFIRKTTDWIKKIIS